MKVLVNATGRCGEGSRERRDGLGLADNNPIFSIAFVQWRLCGSKNGAGGNRHRGGHSSNPVSRFSAISDQFTVLRAACNRSE